MKVLVTGIKGQLGYDVIRELKLRSVECRGVDIDNFNITDEQATLQYIENYNPYAVIHCAAYTAVDKAEENEELCRLVNVQGTKNIAVACKKTNAKMLYISTDYVFPGTGDNPYEVDDSVGPIGVYGQTKLDGENTVKDLLTNYFIVRISWVFGKNGNNFVKTMLRLSKERDELNVVSDQIGSPTYTADLAPLLCDMIFTDKYGVYHATNEGYCSWAEFASEIFELAKMKLKVNYIPTSEYSTKAIRPLNSRLSKDKLEKEGFYRLPRWEDALKRYLREVVR